MKNEIKLKEIFKNHLKEKNIVLENENFDEAFETFLKIRRIYAYLLSKNTNSFEPRQRMFGDT
tara:strand:+ start:1204 stop:1392 length:189 start_codon:yes stop_codon:yes gene_type:complete